MTTTLVTRNINNIQFQKFQIDYLLVDAPDISDDINITNQTLLYNQKGDNDNANFILIGNDNGIAINTNFNNVNANLIDSTKFYVDGNIKIAGTVFCENLSFYNSNIFDINSNISKFIENYSNIHNPFTNINNQNYNTQYKINIANVHASQFNKNYLNINRISNNINRLQFSIKNDYNSPILEDDSYHRIQSSIDIGILGTREDSPAIIHTTLNKQLEFHISKRKSNIQNYYDKKIDNYNPSMIIDTSNCVHINDNNFNENISNIKLNVNGSAYIKQIYTGNNFCNLDSIYLKQNTDSLHPKWMKGGTFNGNYTFNNDLNISNLLKTNKLKSSEIISDNINTNDIETTNLEVVNTINANSINIESLSLNGSNININNSLKTFVIDYKYSNIYTTVNNFKNYIYNSNIIENKIKLKLRNGFIIDTDLHGIINKNSNIYDQYNFLEYKYRFSDIRSNLNTHIENNGINTYYNHLNSNFDFSNISLNIFNHNNVSNIIERNIIYYTNSDLISDIINHLSNYDNVQQSLIDYDDSKYYGSDINDFYIFNNANNFASNIYMYNQQYSIDNLKSFYDNFVSLGITSLNEIIHIYHNIYNDIQLTEFNNKITNYILYSNIDINSFKLNHNISNIDINQIKVELYSLLNSNITFYNNEYIRNKFNNNENNLNKLIDNNRRNNDINDINIYSSNIYNINYISLEIYRFLINRQESITSHYNACNINLLLTNVIDNIDFNNNTNYDIKYRLYLSILSSYTTIQSNNINDAILSYTIDHKPNYSGDQVTFNYKMSIGQDIDQSDKTHRLVIKDENKEQIKFINNNHYGYIGHKQNNSNIDFIISTKHVTNEDNIIFKPGNKNTLYLKADLGRVGINTSNPLHKLDVIGSIRFTDKLYTSYIDRPNCPVINLIEYNNKIKIKNNNTNIIDFENIKEFNLNQSEITVKNIKIKDTVSHDYNNLVAIKKNKDENYMYINEPANLTIGHSSITNKGQINYPINDAAMHIKNSFAGANNNTIIRLFRTDTLGHQDTNNANCIYTGLEFTNISSYNPQIGYSNYEGWYIHNSYNDEFKIGYKNNNNIKDDFIKFNNNKIIINKNLDVNGNIHIRNGCNIYLDISGDIKMNGISITCNLDFNSVNKYYSDRNCNLISFQTNQRDIAIIAHAEYNLIDEDGSFIIGNKNLNYLDFLSGSINDPNVFDAKCIILQNKSDSQSYKDLEPTLDLRSIYTNIDELPKSYLRLSLYKYNNTSKTVSDDKFDIKFEKNSDDILNLNFKFNEDVFFKFYNDNNSKINYFKLGDCTDKTTDKPLLHLEDKNSTLLYLKNTEYNIHKILLYDWEIIANNDNFYIGSNIFNINRNYDNISINNYNNNNYTFNIQNTNNNNQGILNIKNILSNSNINYIRLENLDSSFNIRTTSNSFDIYYNNDDNIFKLNNNGNLKIQNLEVTDLTIKGNVNYSNIISELNDSIKLELFEKIIHKNNNFYLRTYQDDDTALNYTIYLNSRDNDHDYYELKPSVVIDNYYNHEKTLVLRTANYSSNFIIFDNSNIRNSIGFEEDKFIIKNGNNTIFEISENTDINMNNDLIVGNFIIHNNGIIENLNSNNIITHFIKKIDSSNYELNDLIIFEKNFDDIKKNQIARISAIEEYSSNITLDFNKLVDLNPDIAGYDYDNNNNMDTKSFNINEIKEYTHKFEKIFDINKDKIITHKTLHTLSGNSVGSDRRIKTDIINIENSLEKINKLQGVLYTNKFTKNRHAGLIAQDVKKIIPEVVVEDDENILGIEYGNMIGFIVESIKELTFEIKNMKSKLNL
tara:strand:- start:16938 stop:22325 length:5388 start_codon:yes stop_codon:yes gene_type:complete